MDNQRKKILFINREASRKEKLENSLEILNLVIVTQHSWDEIKEFNETNPPDVILLDLSAMEESVGKICIRMMRFFPDIPILVWPAPTMLSSQIDKALGAGAYDFITSEPDSIEIQSRIRAAIRQRELLRSEKQIRKELIMQNMELEDLVEKRTKYLKDSISQLRQHYEEREKLFVGLANDKRTRTIGSLTEGIAHAFNNMLQVIIGHISILRVDAYRSEMQEKNFSAIETAATQATKLVQQLLSYSRKHALSDNEFDVNELARNTVNILQSTLPQNVTITMDLTEPLPSMHGNQTDIQFVLVNLLLNARDALPHGGEIRLETKRMPPSSDKEFERIQINVSDTGIGMNEETLSRIFDPFFTTKVENMGAGLGLSMVQKIIDEHTGKILVSSRLQEGSTFSVEFPLQSRYSYPSTTQSDTAAKKKTPVCLLLLMKENNQIVVRTYLERMKESTILVDSLTSLEDSLMEYDTDVRLLVVDDSFLRFWQGQVLPILHNIDTKIPIIYIQDQVEKQEILEASPIKMNPLTPPLRYRIFQESVNRVL